MSVLTLAVILEHEHLRKVLDGLPQTNVANNLRTVPSRPRTGPPLAARVCEDCVADVARGLAGLGRERYQYAALLSDRDKPFAAAPTILFGTTRPSRRTATVCWTPMLRASCWKLCCVILR